MFRSLFPLVRLEFTTSFPRDISLVVADEKEVVTKLSNKMQSTLLNSKSTHVNKYGDEKQTKNKK